MTEDLAVNNAAAVITGVLGEIKTTQATIVAEQIIQRDLLTRFDERQRGWATKHELTTAEHKLELALAPVAAQAQSAHTRLDTMVGSLASLGAQIGRLTEKLDVFITTDMTQVAEVRGAWKVLRPTLAWVAGVTAAFVGAFLIGRYT